MLEYEFEHVDCDEGGGYSLFGGFGIETVSHQEIICRRAAEGWHYAGVNPQRQRGGGEIETMDLVFERERPET